ncbi:MAG: hypothetical protein KY455_08780 [Euryarchaeota archaeon]|nr:hypothetical protein [Euryarchaeota archaeon]
MTGQKFLVPAGVAVAVGLSALIAERVVFGSGFFPTPVDQLVMMAVIAIVLGTGVSRATSFRGVLVSALLFGLVLVLSFYHFGAGTSPGQTVDDSNLYQPTTMLRALAISMIISVAGMVLGALTTRMLIRRVQ